MCWAGSKFKVWGLVKRLGLRVVDCGFRFGIRVHGLGFAVWGSGLRRGVSGRF